jgi:hypothetical protein
MDLGAKVQNAIELYHLENPENLENLENPEI